MHPSAPTFADGLATREPYLLPLGIMLARLDDFVLVEEEDMKAGIRLLARAVHVVAEGAGAAATAAAMRFPELVRGRRVGLMLSGGNLPLDVLREILGSGEAG
jgi:threonine dehydratase